MNTYFTTINSLTEGVPGSNWQDYISPVIPFDQPQIDLDQNQNAYVKVPAASSGASAREFYGHGMSDDEWSSYQSQQLGNMIMGNDEFNKTLGTQMGINASAVNNYTWYWGTSDNIRAEQWRVDNPFEGNPENLKELIEYKKKSIMETTGDINANFGDPTFSINMGHAQSALNTKWDLYFEFVNKNPLAKLVGYDTWVTANDMHKVDPSGLVLDVVQPWMEVINSYGNLRNDLESRGVEQNSVLWNNEINAFLNNATLTYGGAVSIYSDRNLSESHPNKDYYDSTVNPGFSINEQDILKVIDEILPIFLNDAEETYDNYDQLRLAQQIRERFDTISKLEGGASTYTPSGPSQNALDLIQLMKKEVFV